MPIRSKIRVQRSASPVKLRSSIVLLKLADSVVPSCLGPWASHSSVLSLRPRSFQSIQLRTKAMSRFRINLNLLAKLSCSGENLWATMEQGEEFSIKLLLHLSSSNSSLREDSHWHLSSCQQICVAGRSNWPKTIPIAPPSRPWLFINEPQPWWLKPPLNQRSRYVNRV